MPLEHLAPCLAFIVARMCCWLMSSVATGTFCAELISGESGLVSLHGVAPSTVQDLTFICPELQKVVLAHFSTLLGSLRVQGSSPQLPLCAIWCPHKPAEDADNGTNCLPASSMTASLHHCRITLRFCPCLWPSSKNLIRLGLSVILALRYWVSHKDRL